MLRVGDVDERVAGGVRRADLDQLDAPPPDVEVEPAGRRSASASPARSRRSRTHRRSSGTARPPRRAHRSARRASPAEPRGSPRPSPPTRRSRCRGTDRRPLVAVAVVAVGVGVDHRCERTPRTVCCAIASSIAAVSVRSNSVSIKHRRAVADDQPGVAPSPAAVGLQVGEATVAELVESMRVRPRRRRCDAHVTIIAAATDVRLTARTIARSTLRPCASSVGSTSASSTWRRPPRTGTSSSMTIYDVENAPQRRDRRDHPAADPRTHRPARTVPAPPGRGAARTRPAVLDRGPRLRHRLPRPPPRRAGAGHARAARRGGRPHPGPRRSTVAARCGSCTSSRA